MTALRGTLVYNSDNFQWCVLFLCQAKLYLSINTVIKVYEAFASSIQLVAPSLINDNNQHSPVVIIHILLSTCSQEQQK